MQCQRCRYENAALAAPICTGASAAHNAAGPFPTYCCPKEPLIPILEETLEELGNRQPDPHPSYRARVVLAGSEIDDPELIRLIEEAGALVVADRFCLGAFPGREEISLKEDEDILTGICRHYMEGGQCPR